MPEKFQNAPELDPTLVIFFNAFQDLTTARTYGMSEGPIPWLAVAQYCDYNGYEGDLWEDVMYHVRALDREYLKIREEVNSRNRKG